MTSTQIARFGVRALALALALALAGVALSLPACATMTRGTTQVVTVQSTPPGAHVRTSNGFECAATPCDFRMPRKTGFTATFDLDGYVTQTQEVRSGMAGGGAAGMAGNLLVGGIIGGVVDASSGAMNDLMPNPVVATLLTPAQHAAAEAARSSTSSGEQ